MGGPQEIGLRVQGTCLMAKGTGSEVLVSRRSLSCREEIQRKGEEVWGFREEFTETRKVWVSREEFRGLKKRTKG